MSLRKSALETKWEQRDPSLVLHLVQNIMLSTKGLEYMLPHAGHKLECAMHLTQGLLPY